MPDPDDDAIEIKVEPVDADSVYEKYLETCRRAGIAPMSRERAAGLVQEWNEVPSGRPEPTQH